MNRSQKIKYHRNTKWNMVFPSERYGYDFCEEDCLRVDVRLGKAYETSEEGLGENVKVIELKPTIDGLSPILSYSPEIKDEFKEDCLMVLLNLKNQPNGERFYCYVRKEDKPAHE